MTSAAAIDLYHRIDSSSGAPVLEELGPSPGTGLYILRTTTREGGAGCCEAIATFDVRDRLGAVGVPVLAIAGTDDLTTPPEMVAVTVGSVPDDRFEVVPDCAHLLDVKKPLQVTGLLAEHRASAATARS